MTRYPQCEHVVFSNRTMSRCPNGVYGHDPRTGQGLCIGHAPDDAMPPLAYLVHAERMGETWRRLSAITTIIHTALVIQHHGDERERQGRARERGDTVAFLNRRAERHYRAHCDDALVNTLRAHADSIASGVHVGAARKAEGSNG